MRQVLAILALFIGMGLAVSHPAQATLIGDEVGAVRIVNGVPQGPLGGPFSAIVVAGSEEYMPQSGLPFTIDIEDSSIVITSTTNFSVGPEDFLEISSLDWVGMSDGRITGVSAVAENIIVGPAAGPFTPYETTTGVTFFDHAVRIDLVSTDWGRNLDGTTSTDPGRLSIELQTAHDPPNNNVPEPLTSMLGIMGLGALGYATKRRRFA